VNGHVYGFAGATFAHADLSAKLLARLHPHVLPCRAVGSDMLIEMATSSRYADIVVTCDDRDFDPAATVVHFPKLIIEVLSEATAQDDLGPKMREYQAIATLEEYVTIDSRKRCAQIFRRENDRWELLQPVTAGSLELRSVGLAIDLDELYTSAGIPEATTPKG
jgi:Uma2 family endonuclease